MEYSIGGGKGKEEKMEADEKIKRGREDKQIQTDEKQDGRSRRRRVTQRKGGQRKYIKTIVKYCNPETNENVENKGNYKRTGLERDQYEREKGNQKEGKIECKRSIEKQNNCKVKNTKETRKSFKRKSNK